MGLKICGECGGLLYETAETCLHCGATTKSATTATTWLAVLAWVVTASIGLVVLSAQFSGPKSPPPGPATPVPARVGTTAPATVVPRRVSVPALPPEETAKATIEQAQRLLARLGYPVGPADGIVGPKTRAAVKAFQRNEGLAENGKVSDQLLSQLRRARERI